jgi:hypothetical protein
MFVVLIWRIAREWSSAVVRDDTSTVARMKVLRGWAGSSVAMRPLNRIVSTVDSLFGPADVSSQGRSPYAATGASAS